MKGRNFIQGAVILTIFGIVGKIVGALYRVPLTSIIGAEGLGLYQMVFPLYSLLLTISSSAFPNAIAKLLSESYAQNNFNKARVIFGTSLKILIWLSSVSFLIVVIFAKYIAAMQGNVHVYKCYYAIAPSIIIVALIASLRGYYQARENMLPSAISGLIEQVAKMAFGLAFAKLFINHGVVMGAFGALLGVTISELVALIYLGFKYAFEHKTKMQKTLENKKYTKTILSTTLPITLGSIVLPLSQFVDSALIVNLLTMLGYNILQATKMFGIQTGVVGSIINMPVVFSLAISSAVLPMISRLKVNDKGEIFSAVKKSIILTLFLGVCSILGLIILAKPIISILYSKSLNEADIELAAKLLKVASFGVCYLSLAQTTTGLLQGMGKFNLPVYALIVGGAVKLILNIILIQMPSINIYGAEIATVLCYAVVSVINLINVFRSERKLENV